MKQQVIVSLTSFPAAIHYAIGAVKSILQGSVLPDKVVLYLTFPDFGEIGIPQDLLKLAENNPIFEIRNNDPDLRSYQKLIPALNDFPEAVVVTIDDDVLYHRHMLRDLLKVHRIVPDAIVAHRVRRIIPDAPYSMWKKYKWYHFLIKRIHAGYKNLLTGVGGVLYPPHSLKAEMLDVKIYSKIAPTADDLWFWAAAVANRRKIVPVPFGRNKLHYGGKPLDISLMKTNIESGIDRNALVMQAILENYPDIRQIIASRDE
ncbi:MAG: glycosyltransferase [Bacteroides sp.]|nr:hypothetical protein [Ruminococcus flavefaciens]MCM1553892.1 glycosyltransferase [Bacteroides sp.]